jgi:hypothetical protein
MPELLGAGMLAGVVHPTPAVHGDTSPPAFAELTTPSAAAARLEQVGGGHALHPAHRVVVAFVDEPPAGRAERWPSIA